MALEIARRLKMRLEQVRPATSGGVGGRPQDGRIHSADRVTDSTLLDDDPPAGHSQWNGRLLVAALGDVSDD